MKTCIFCIWSSFLSATRVTCISVMVWMKIIIIIIIIDGMFHSWVLRRKKCWKRDWANKLNRWKSVREGKERVQKSPSNGFNFQFKIANSIEFYQELHWTEGIFYGKWSTFITFDKKSHANSIARYRFCIVNMLFHLPFSCWSPMSTCCFNLILSLFSCVFCVCVSLFLCNILFIWHQFQ